MIVNDICSNFRNVLMMADEELVAAEVGLFANQVAGHKGHGDAPGKCHVILQHQYQLLYLKHHISANFLTSEAALNTPYF